MLAVKRRVVTQDDKYLYTHFYWWCVGCDEQHVWALKEQPSDYAVPEWEFDGNLESPTVSPSILTDGSNPAKRCHVFIKNGQIEYLGDCWHKLAGQTVPMVDVPKWLEN